MSYVVTQTGQCGNQLGQCFFDLLSDVVKNQSSANSSFSDETFNRFFIDAEDKIFARSVLFDTEPKVIEEISKPFKGRSWFYRDDGAVRVHDLGSGNNWAMGYHCYGPTAQDAALNAVRKEMERCDHLISLLQLSSVAGGTGSGFGSYLSQLFRDEFSTKSSTNIIMWPFHKCDVTIQAYNSILSLSSFQESSDAIFLFENDWLMKLCRQKLRIKSSSLQDLNKVASLQLAHVLLPIGNNLNFSFTFNDTLAHLVPHPQFKLVGFRSVPQEPSASLPFSAHTWPGLLQSLKRMILYNTAIDEVYGPHSSSSDPVSRPPVSLANLLILRGRECETAKPDIFSAIPYTSWVPSSMRLKSVTCGFPFLQYDKTAVLANNGQMSYSCVDLSMGRAWRMFSHKAYFHHYEQCGLTSDDFKQSAMTVEQIIASYKSLHV
ncbi:tubulin delta chain isoform X1 [Parasteatoda tepidariorum]|nr:tubulin delta chain isoform X1 [Parasteatoda tepidariorum]